MTEIIFWNFTYDETQEEKADKKKNTEYFRTFIFGGNIKEWKTSLSSGYDFIGESFTLGKIVEKRV